jgi:hypothetical protein
MKAKKSQLIAKIDFDKTNAYIFKRKKLILIIRK